MAKPLDEEILSVTKEVAEAFAAKDAYVNDFPRNTTANDRILRPILVLLGIDSLNQLTPSDAGEIKSAYNVVFVMFQRDATELE